MAKDLSLALVSELYGITPELREKVGVGLLSPDCQTELEQILDLYPGTFKRDGGLISRGVFCGYGSSPDAQCPEWHWKDRYEYVTVEYGRHGNVDLPLRNGLILMTSEEKEAAIKEEEAHKAAVEKAAIEGERILALEKERIRQEKADYKSWKQDR